MQNVFSARTLPEAFLSTPCRTPTSSSSTFKTHCRKSLILEEEKEKGENLLTQIKKLMSRGINVHLFSLLHGTEFPPNFCPCSSRLQTFLRTTTFCESKHLRTISGNKLTSYFCPGISLPFQSSSLQRRRSISPRLIDLLCLSCPQRNLGRGFRK